MQNQHWTRRLVEAVRQLFLRTMTTKPGARVGREERRDPLQPEADAPLLARRRDDNVGGEG